MDQQNEFNLNKILLTVDVDDRDSTAKAFSYSIKMAKIFDAELGICSVLENNDINIYDSLTPDKIEAKRDSLRKIVGQYADEAEQLGVDHVTPIIAEGGDIEDVILDQIIPDYQPDLLVCGFDSIKDFPRDGKISAKLSNRADISVSVIK